MTYYRTYRPKTVDELDLTVVRERLSAIVKSKNFTHAYLFFGPRGTGKTSAARIMAREAGVEAEDTMELDAASHRGIDDIRELRERVGIAPMVGTKKAYIIDEVHMLTAEAFNALLKTLEEPPEHVLFFLCTTEREKVPETIASRCVPIPFPQATSAEITRALSRTVEGEKLSAAPGVLDAIASWADGSFREAQTILEGAASPRRGKTIAVADVERVVGGSLTRDVTRYVTAIIQGNSQDAVSAIETVVRRGGDLMVMARLILSDLRDRLVKDRTARLLLVTKRVEECTRTLKYSFLPQLPLEIAAMEMGEGESGVRSQESEGSQESRVKSQRGVGSQQSGVRGEKARQYAEAAEQSENRHVSVPKNQKDPIKTKPTPHISFSISDLLEQWPRILESVRKKNHGIVTLLSHCRPLSVDGGVVLVEAKYQFHKDQLMQERFRSLVEAEMSGVVGGPLGVRFVLGPHTERVLKTFASDDNIRAVADDELSSIAEEIFSMP